MTRRRNRDGYGLVVVEQEWRQLYACAELITAGDAGSRVDRMAQAPQPIDIATHSPAADLEPPGELRAGPRPGRRSSSLAKSIERSPFSPRSQECWTSQLMLGSTYVNLLSRG